MAAPPTVFEPLMLGCIPAHAGLLGGTDPSIAYIPYIPYWAARSYIFYDTFVRSGLGAFKNAILSIKYFLHI